jgi:rSAM/selenodomain-associated transferase 1
MRPTLVVFVKEPRPGRVKTRLAAGIGRVDAAWWYRHATARLIARVARDRRWRTVLAVTPDAEGLRSRVWPPPQSVPRSAQGPGDLGRRMARFLRAEPGTRIPPGPVAVIGTDIPGLRPCHLAEAFRLLSRHDAVLGPASDGGYWLIGLRNGRSAPRDLLDRVRWSTRHALADTLARLGALDVGLAARLSDVDTAEELRRASRHADPADTACRTSEVDVDGQRQLVVRGQVHDDEILDRPA